MTQQKLTPVLMVALVAMGIGYVGIFAFDSESAAPAASLSVGAMTGHLTAIATDSDGNIKQYVQTDNFVTAYGEDCTAKMLFFGTASSYSNSTALCPQAFSPTNNNNFNVISLLEDQSDCTPAATDTDIDASASCDLIVDAGLVPKRIAITSAEIETSAQGTSGQVLVELDNIFTLTGTGPVTVTAAAITNTTSTTEANHGVLAKTLIDPAIVLNQDDTLTVNWDFALGGVASLSSDTT
jgi:hypothetical protein